MKEVENLKPFTKFCVTLGMIPTSYKVSLTYEEQLMWLCNYLENTVIPAINNNAEALEEVQTLFVQLKNYVDNYFDNLDVQEEIDTKLDEMATDGTLERIINQEIFDDLNTQIQTINGEITSINNDITSINNQLDGLDITSKNIVLLSNYYKKIIRHSGSVHIGCMGDSITRGVDTVSSDIVQSTITTDSGYTQTTTVAGTTYPEKLQDLMQSLFTDFQTTVSNYGISGSTVKDACTYWTQNKNTDLMLMMFGLNDANESYEGAYYGDISQFVSYYEILIKRYLNFNSAIMLLLPTSGCAMGRDNFKYDNITAYYQAIRMLGKKYNIPVIETPSEITNNFVASEFSDGTHLNTKGYSLLASRICACLINANIHEPTPTSVSWNSHDSVINVDNYTHIIQTGSASDVVTSYNKRQNTLANNTVVSLGIRTTEDNMLVSINGYQCVGTLKVDDGLISVPMFNGVTENLINQAEYNSSASTETRNSKKANLNYLVNFSNYVVIPNKGYHLITFKVTQANSFLAQFMLFRQSDITQNNKIVGTLNSSGVYTLTPQKRALFSNDRTGINIFLVHLLVPNSFQCSYIVNTNGNVLGFASSGATTGLTFNIDSDGNWVFTNTDRPNATIVIKL